MELAGTSLPPAAGGQHSPHPRVDHTIGTRIPLRIPLVARGHDDLVLLRANLAALRRSGRGFRVDLPSLAEPVRHGLERSSSAYARACGCAIAGIAAVGCFVGGIAFVAATGLGDGLQWRDIALAAAMLPLSMIAAGVAKWLSIHLARRHLARRLDVAIAALRPPQGDSP